MPRKRNAEDTRRALLKAAEQEFVDKGFDAARVDEIALIAGVNKRMIYVYFEHKEGLYQAMLERVLTVAFERTAAKSQPKLPARAQIEAIVRPYFHFLADNPRFVRLLSWEHLNHGRWETTPYERFANLGLELVAEAVEHGRKTGEFRADIDVRILMVAFAGTCIAFFNRHHLLQQSWGLDLDDAKERSHAIDHVLAVFFDGIIAPKEM